MTWKRCPNCGEGNVDFDALSGFVENHDEQHHYECENPSCTVSEYFELPPEEVRE